MRAFAALLLVGCGHAAMTDTRGDITIPIGLTLDGEATAPTTHLTLEAARKTREQLRADQGEPGLQPGERAWFFRAFGSEHLVFLDCRYAPVTDPRPIKRTGRYEVLRRLVVDRTDHALDVLGVRDEIQQYEGGVCGLRVGMPASEVHARFGKPTNITVPAAAGCVQESFGELYVSLCFDKVKHISGRCP